MKIARVKAERDTPSGTVEGGCLPTYRPLASKRPLIGRQTTGRRIHLTSIQADAATGRKVLHPVIADVGLRRPQVLPIRRGFDALGVDRHNAAAKAGAI